MTRTQPENFYENRRALFAAFLKDINEKIILVSNIRLGVALTFFALLFSGLSNHPLLYPLPLLLVVFVLFVRWHARLFQKRVHLQNLIQIQHDELHAITGDFSNYASGSEFIDTHHSYTHDLDIFGEGSLFQFINRGSTRGGKKLLADRLSSGLRTGDEIIKCQDAVKELTGKNEFRHEVQALAMEIDEHPDDQRQLQHWLRQPSFIFGKSSYRFILAVFPVITTFLIVSAFFIDGISPFAFLAAGLQWVFLGFHLKQVNIFHQYVSGKKNTLEKYARILMFMREETFSSPVMQSLAGQAADADQNVRQLASLLNAFDARMNIITNLLVNSVLLYDLQCVYRLEKWKEENASQLMGWLETIHETEFLSSLGTFAFNHSNFAFPALNDDLKLSGIGMGHPLLSESERVLNDMHLDVRQSIMLITGANMAGKSTFLRSLGVNVVLALSGAPVCAKEFNCPLIELRSGMRTADSLKEHQSYFYAELDRLKSIMDDLRQGKPLLILLDEILKGTNSTDKQAGSIALVKQLVNHHCLVLIATHDLALGDLEKVFPGRIMNYSFEANIENGQLSFDYKLKRGLAQKMNATFLMRKMGILDPGLHD
jgi:DNA mismatch repair ATPase MutS